MQSCKPQAASRKAALPGTREKRPSPPGSFPSPCWALNWVGVYARKSAASLVHLPIERGAVGSVTSLSMSFVSRALQASPSLVPHTTASHRIRECSAINAMLIATQARMQARTHARTQARRRTEPPIVRSSWCVVEPNPMAGANR